MLAHWSSTFVSRSSSLPVRLSQFVVPVRRVPVRPGPNVSSGSATLVAFESAPAVELRTCSFISIPAEPAYDGAKSGS